jgi:4-hydroxy-3-methylbut-2-en-1-yl diphosphate synthase IspG/GcpE
VSPHSATERSAGARCLRCGNEIGDEVHDVAVCDRSRSDGGLAPAPWWATCPTCGRLLHDVNRRDRTIHRLSDCEARMARIDAAMEARPQRFNPMSAGF